MGWLSSSEFEGQDLIYNHPEIDTAYIVNIFTCNAGFSRMAVNMYLLDGLFYMGVMWVVVKTMVQLCVLL